MDFAAYALICSLRRAQSRSALGEPALIGVLRARGSTLLPLRADGREGMRRDPPCASSTRRAGRSPVPDGHRRRVADPCRHRSVERPVAVGVPRCDSGDSRPGTRHSVFGIGHRARRGRGTRPRLGARARSPVTSKSRSRSTQSALALPCAAPRREPMREPCSPSETWSRSGNNRGPTTRRKPRPIARGWSRTSVVRRRGRSRRLPMETTQAEAVAKHGHRVRDIHRRVVRLTCGSPSAGRRPFCGGHEDRMSPRGQQTPEREYMDPAPRRLPGADRGMCGR